MELLTTEDKKLILSLELRRWYSHRIHYSNYLYAGLLHFKTEHFRLLSLDVGGALVWCPTGKFKPKKKRKCCRVNNHYYFVESFEKWMFEDLSTAIEILKEYVLEYESEINHL